MRQLSKETLRPKRREVPKGRKDVSQRLDKCPKTNCLKKRRKPDEYKPNFDASDTLPANTNPETDAPYSSQGSTNEELSEKSGSEVDSYRSFQGITNFCPLPVTRNSEEKTPYSFQENTNVAVRESSSTAVSTEPDVVSEAGIQCSIFCTEPNHEKIQDLERKLALSRDEEVKLREELEKLAAGVKRTFSDDQVLWLQ